MGSLPMLVGLRRCTCKCLLCLTITGRPVCLPPRQNIAMVLMLEIKGKYIVPWTGPKSYVLGKVRPAGACLALDALVCPCSRPQRVGMHNHNWAGISPTWLRTQPSDNPATPPCPPNRPLQVLHDRYFMSTMQSDITVQLLNSFTVSRSAARLLAGWLAEQSNNVAAHCCCWGWRQHAAASACMHMCLFLRLPAWQGREASTTQGGALTSLSPPNCPHPPSPSAPAVHVVRQQQPAPPAVGCGAQPAADREVGGAGQGGRHHQQGQVSWAGRGGSGLKPFASRVWGLGLHASHWAQLFWKHSLPMMSPT